MTTPEQLGMVQPVGSDLINTGDDDIAQNARAVAQIFDAQKLKNDVYDTYASALLFRLSPPGGDISTWTGVNNSGIVRVPTQAAADAIPGRPPGAGPGLVWVLPVGTTASVVRWQEFLPNGRTWERTVSTVPSFRTGWKQKDVMKSVGTSLTLTGGVAPQVRTDFGGRLPINFGVDISSWKIHLRNYNLRDSQAYPGVLEIALSIGEAATDAAGEYTGNWVTGTQALLSPSLFTIDSPVASELVTPTYEYFLDKSKAYLLSYRIQGATGQLVVEAQGGGFVLDTPGAVHSPVAPGTRSKTMPLMVWIEAEVPESTPVRGVVGDSLSVGVSSTLPVHDSWLAKKCRTEGALPVFWAASGDTLANFSNSAVWKFHQWAAMAQPDMVYFAMGSNDLFGASSTLEQMKQKFYACWNPLREQTGVNLVLCTIFPRFVGGSPEEAVRKLYNDWLETELPGGASFTFDAAAPITNEDGSTLNLKWAASPTDIHLKSSGYAQIAAAI